MKRILIVEENEEYRDKLVNAFLKAGFGVNDTNSPLIALGKVSLANFDAVISGLRLPEMSGVNFMESVKNISPCTACIILTDDPDENSELESIKNNIDLYIEKTKSMQVIMTYVDKLVFENDTGSYVNTVLVSQKEDLKLFPKEHRVTKYGKDVTLTPKEYEILKVFLVNKNKILSKEEFVEIVWDTPVEELDLRIVTSHINNLREKLNANTIISVRGKGYCWEE